MYTFVFLVFWLLFPFIVQAGGGPENVAVLVNADSWASMAIANEYVSLRRIPPVNVIYFHDLKSHEETSVEEFRQKILLPALEALEKRALAGQIDYLVYSSDFPTMIGIEEDIKAQGHDKTVFPYASITGLSYLYQMVMAKDKRYYSMKSNGYLNPPFLGVADTSWSTLEKALYQKVLILLKDREWEKAQSILEKLLVSHPKSPSLLYNLACTHARQGKKEKAIDFLTKAVETGWCNFVHTLQDQDLELIRNTKEMNELAEQMQKKEPLYNVHSSGFRNAYSFNEFGAIVREGEGKRYLLSMMLGATSGRGNGVKEVMAYLRQGEKVDSTFPSGTIYYMSNSNIRSRTRQPVFPSAVAVLKEMGVQAEILEGTIPIGKKDVMGAMIGIDQFDWESSKSIILPGSICEHLTSFGGDMKERSSQTPLSEFLRHGAIASSGTVIEPYAFPSKFPNPFLHVHYRRGCTTAESFYQSVAAPFQLLVVGDPLCRPWGRKPPVIVGGVKPGQKVKGTITLYPDVEKGYPHPIHNYQLFLAGRRYDVCRPGGSFALDTTLLLDGMYFLTIVAMEDDPIQNQGKTTIPVYVQNSNSKIEFPPLPSVLGWNDTLSIPVFMKEAQEISLFHNARRLDSIEGEHGELKISSSLLGLGKGELQILATKKNPQEGAIAKLPFEVIPSFYFMPVSLPLQLKIHGLRLAAPGFPTQIIPSTFPYDWLAKAGIGPLQEWKIEGYFDAQENDIYQFQLFCSGEIEIQVNHTTLLKENDCQGWKYIPVPLVAGTHHFSLKARLKDSAMRLSFGNRGTYSLNSKIFYHFKE